MVSHVTNSAADAWFMRLTMLVRSTVVEALTAVEAEDMVAQVRVTKRLWLCNKKIVQTTKNFFISERVA